MSSHQRRSLASWQVWGARLAAAVLLAALLGGVAAPRARAEGKFGPGWTHLAGTSTCLHYYDKTNGALLGRPIDDGRVVVEPGLLQLVGTGYTHMAGTGNHVFFYNQLTGGVRGFRIDTGGCTWISTTAWEGYATSWTHVVGIGDQALLFYNKATGARASGWIDSTGTFHQVETGGFSAGWTHIVAAGSRVLFYKANNTPGSISATGVFDAEGRFTQKTNGGFATNWTHLAGTRNGGFLFYDKRTGKGMSGRLDADARWVLFDGDVGFDKGWTQDTGAGARSAVFYNRKTGKPIGDYTPATKRWRQTVSYDE